LDHRILIQCLLIELKLINDLHVQCCPIYLMLWVILVEINFSQFAITDVSLKKKSEKAYESEHYFLTSSINCHGNSNIYLLQIPPRPHFPHKTKSLLIRFWHFYLDSEIGKQGRSRHRIISSDFHSQFIFDCVWVVDSRWKAVIMRAILHHFSLNFKPYH